MRPRRTTTAAGALVLGLLFTGCANGTQTPARTATEPPTSAATTTPPATVEPTAPEEPDPVHLSGQVPSTAQLDQAIADADAAYRRHRALYDEGFRTGFVDEALVEELVATTSGDLRELVRQGAEEFEGPPVDGASEVVFLDPVWLHLPVSAVDRPEVTFETCLFITGGPNPEDSGELALTVRMVQEEDERWVVWSQQNYGEECPD